LSPRFAAIRNSAAVCCYSVGLNTIWDTINLLNRNKSGDSTSLNVLQLLSTANANFSPSTGVFYGGDQTKTSDLNNVMNGVNTKGDIN